MHHPIRWTSPALKDLISIRNYLKEYSPLAAKKEAEKIKKGVEGLARFPKSGRKFLTIASLREIIIGNYRIFYRVQSNRVEILRVLHGRQNISLI